MYCIRTRSVLIGYGTSNVSIYQYQFVTFNKNANIIYQVKYLLVPLTGIQNINHVLVGTFNRNTNINNELACNFNRKAKL